MAQKYELITKLYQETLKTVSMNYESWTNFLISACKNYHCRFDEQILIYAQCPEATAVLELKKWNEKFGRWVKRGATGIAVFDDEANGNVRLKYYFDIADTKEGRISYPVPQWKMDEKYEKEISASLEEHFGRLIDKNNFTDVIFSATENAVDLHMQDYMQDLKYFIENSFLDGLDNQNIESLFREAIKYSVVYMVLTRCNYIASDFINQEDMSPVFNFNTTVLINALGVASKDIAEMEISVIATAVKRQQIRQTRIDQTLVENEKIVYNKKKTDKVDGGAIYGNNIRNAGRLQITKSDGSTGETGDSWEIRGTQEELFNEPPEGTVYKSVDGRSTEYASEDNTGRSGQSDGTDDRTDDEGTERDREIKGNRSDDVGRNDEQYPQGSRGERVGGADLQLEWYDRGAEDKSLPFFHNDQDIKEIILTTPHLKVTKADIVKFFESNEEDSERTEYVKSIFNNEPTQLILKDSRMVGYKTYQNVLHLWEGSYTSRKAQGYYDWGVIAAYLEGMLLLKELRDISEPLPTVLEQLTILNDKAEDKTSAFSFTQEIVDRVLTSGSGIEQGKFRIYSYFLQGHTIKGKIDFLKNEYGWGGRFPAITGTEIDELHDSKGIVLNRGYGEDIPKLLLKWEKVAKRIDELIAVGRYMSKKEMAYLPEYEKQFLSLKIFNFYANQPVEIVRPYPYGTDYYEGTKVVRPQLEEPNRVEQILGTMETVLTNMQESNVHYFYMKETYRDLKEYQSGTYSLFSPIPNGIGKRIDQEFDVMQVKKYSAILNRVSADGVDPEIQYELSAGTLIFIGTGEFEIQSVGSERVVLRDLEYPLFTNEMTYDEFKQKLWENPANDHLRVDKKTLSLAQKNYKILMELAPEVLKEESSAKKFQAGESFLTCTIESIDRNRIAVSHYFFENGSSFADPDMEFVVDHENQALYARTYQMDKLKRFQQVCENGNIDTELEEELNQFANSWFHNIKEQGYKPVKEIMETEIVDVTPKWEITKTSSETQPMVLHPETSPEEKLQYHIQNDKLGEGTPKEKFQANIEAITILHICENENRLATEKEQKILSGYVGWGGLPDAFDETKATWSKEYHQLKEALTEEEYAMARQSTLTAFYTPSIVVRAMYQAFENMGLKAGNILEPSCATGNFIGLKPDSLTKCKVYGVEIDSISGRIAQQLYQKSDIAVQGFENAKLPDSFFDVAVGNVPFGNFKLSDKKYDKYKFNIHDYFFAKTLDKLRPGGVMAFITSSYTLDKKLPTVRKYLAQRAEFLGAIRLPNNTFKKNAGTKVTSDIIFLQKRDHMVTEEPDWIHLDMDENNISMNSYFVKHPEMVLGDMIMESTQYGMASTCRPYENVELKSLLDRAIPNINEKIEEYQMEELAEENDKSIPANPSVANFSYTVLDGEVYYRENSLMRLVNQPLIALNRIKGMIAIRDCTRKLIEYQTESYSDADIRNEQGKLNQLYDSFIEKYGLINARVNSMVFREDSSYPLLCSLEVIAEGGTLERKADMFTKRTICPHITVTKVDTASEALVLSLAERVRVDMEYMCSLTGKSAEKIEKELEGIIFRCPDTALDEPPHFISADEYLSGNVREKLKKVKEAAEHTDIYRSNIVALEKVQPKDLQASEISVRLGTTWVPQDDIENFMFTILDTPNYYKPQIKVQFSELTGGWYIEGKKRDNTNIKVNNTYGTRRINAYKIIEETLNLHDIRIYDYIVDNDGKQKPVLNKKETAIAQGKQEIIKQAFHDWIWKDSERRRRLTKYYNEKFNAIRQREYDGSHLQFSGINPEIALCSHQKNGAARVIYGGNALLAGVVGSGKTYTIVAAAMESKRLGLCNKSMVVVQNHIIEQFASEWLELYPSANILVSTKKDFEKGNRKKFCARIATGDYDGVIIGHSQFGKIPISQNRQIKFIQEQIKEIVEEIREMKESSGDKFSIKQSEKLKKSLEVKLTNLSAQAWKDDVVDFEELGVDRLFVDEADNYKNLYTHTKIRNVSGIAQTEAQKSFDMFQKCRYLDEVTGGHGVIFATGTPISNSIVELYTMQRYLQYDTLTKYNLQQFDSWASTFGDTVTAMELAPEGSGYRLKTRFAKFYNLPELMMMFRQIADIQTADMLNLPVPKANYRVITLNPSEAQKNMVEELAKRAESVRNGMVNATVDNMLLITNDGRKMALDQRIVNELLPDETESKVNACVDETFRIWAMGKERKLTQLIFCDLSTPKKEGFNIYDEVKKKLLKKGIPADEFAFIHDANTEIRKKELYSKVRRGAVRVLMGSTFKMGAGTNVQDLIVASHDLDCPWRPRDLEQRAGRTIRRGNKNKEVDIIRYVTEGTFDAYLYQIIENKQKFISQIMTSKNPVRCADDVDEAVLSYAEIKALATGNPHIKEKMSLDIQVSKLQLLKQSYLNQKYELEDKIITHYPKEIKFLNEVIRGYQADINIVKEQSSLEREIFSPMQIKGVIYTEKQDAGKAIVASCKGMNSPEGIKIGSYRGLSMELLFETNSREFILTLKGSMNHAVTLSTDIIGNITRLDNEISRFEEKLIRCEEKLVNVKMQLKNAEEEVKKQFPQEKELLEATERLGILNELMDMDKSDMLLLEDESDTNKVNPQKSKKFKLKR